MRRACSLLVYNVLLKLKTGLILAVRQSCGTIPVFRDLLKRMAKHGARGLAAIFRILGGMWSGPAALFSFNPWSIFKTPSSVTFMSCIEGLGADVGSGMCDGSSLLKTDWYCRFSISALPLASEMRRPFSFNGDVPVLSLLFALMWLQNLFWMLLLGSFSSNVVIVFSMYVQWAFLRDDCVRVHSLFDGMTFCETHHSSLHFLSEALPINAMFPPFSLSA